MEQITFDLDKLSFEFDDNENLEYVTTLKQELTTLLTTTSSVNVTLTTNEDIQKSSFIKVRKTDKYYIPLRMFEEMDALSLLRAKQPQPYDHKLTIFTSLFVGLFGKNNLRTIMLDDGFQFYFMVEDLIVEMQVYFIDIEATINVHPPEYVRRDIFPPTFEVEQIDEVYSSPQSVGEEVSTDPDTCETGKYGIETKISPVTFTDTMTDRCQTSNTADIEPDMREKILNEIKKSPTKSVAVPRTQWGYTTIHLTYMRLFEKGLLSLSVTDLHFIFKVV